MSLGTGDSYGGDDGPRRVGSSGLGKEPEAPSAKQTAECEVEKQMDEAPLTPGRPKAGAACVVSKETAEGFRTAEAETVRAEHDARVAEQLACEAQELTAKAAATQDIERKSHR